MIDFFLQDGVENRRRVGHNVENSWANPTEPFRRFGGNNPRRQTCHFAPKPLIWLKTPNPKARLLGKPEMLPHPERKSTNPNGLQGILPGSFLIAKNEECPYVPGTELHQICCLPLQKKKIPTNNVGPVTGNDADVPGWYLESGSLQSASEKKKRQRTWWVSWDPWCWCLTRQIGQCDQMPEKRNLSSQQWMRPANPWKAIRQEVIMSKPG